MNIRAALVSLFVTATLSIPAQADVHLGAMVGSLSSSLSGSTPSGTKLTSRSTVGVGAIIDIGLTRDVRLSLQPMYLPRGAHLAVSVPGSSETRDSVAIELNYLSVPLLARVIADNGIAYVIGGLELGFLLSAEWKAEGEPTVDISESIRSVDIAADLGVGILPRLGRVRGMVELRYSQSLSNTTETDPESGFVPRVKYSGFQLWLGVLVPMGGGDE